MEPDFDYGEVLHRVFGQISKMENKGQVATYIPELGKIEPNKFGVCLQTVDGKVWGLGDYDEVFSIQSISKVLALSMVYSELGDQIWSRVGVEPSGNAFNSLMQLEVDNGIPRNPFINAGALVICDLLLSTFSDASARFLSYVQAICGDKQLRYSEEIAASEKSVGYRNIAMCYFIKSYGNLENEPEEVLDFYFKMCSLELSCKALCRTFQFLANDNFRTADNRKLLTLSQAKRINAIMQTCGFYDESGEFAFRVGLPGKSGVGGGIVALHPDKYVVAVWSPRLNEHGNSHRGMKFLELLTTELQSSIF